MTWRLSAHACRQCLGRILQHESQFRCACCGAECEGDPEGICGCGFRVGEGAVRARRYFLCIPNASRGPDNPSEMAIRFDPHPPDPPPSTESGGW